MQWVLKEGQGINQTSDFSVLLCGARKYVVRVYTWL